MGEFQRQPHAATGQNLAMLVRQAHEEVRQPGRDIRERQGFDASVRPEEASRHLAGDRHRQIAVALAGLLEVGEGDFQDASLAQGLGIGVANFLPAETFLAKEFTGFEDGERHLAAPLVEAGELHLTLLDEEDGVTAIPRSKDELPSLVDPSLGLAQEPLTIFAPQYLEHVDPLEVPDFIGFHGLDPRLSRAQTQSTLNQTTLGIFAKEPRPGRVKTRLGRDVGDVAAAELYTAMLADTVTWATQIDGARTALFYDGAAPTAYLDPDSLTEVEHCPQGPGDLGDRLGRAAGSASQRDWLPLLLLGSDSPDLPAALVREAVEALAGAEIVLGPTSDGGVWCIGIQSEVEGFFAELPWSSPQTGMALQSRATERGLRCRLVQEWRDVDDASDLLALSERLRAGESFAPQTERWLARRPSALEACVKRVRAES